MNDLKRMRDELDSLLRKIKNMPVIEIPKKEMVAIIKSSLKEFTS